MSNFSKRILGEHCGWLILYISIFFSYLMCISLRFNPDSGK
ncbi:putative membrane protein [Chlamydia avium]|uniref:Membrane protein n=1 Tax=Chlamydia avium TaxID=1457141 RepID=A0ABP2X6J9_9CHLA|nr:putative membrane protein [Chlamydia psittaci 10_743_SC13]EPP38391.1 putative membrane protein [Chlamydia avium]